MIDFLSDSSISEFRRDQQSQLKQYLDRASSTIVPAESLKVDLHCHDFNSDVPDELWGRILGLPETWLKTKNLVKTLKANNCDVITITNHNNARSCWDLLDKGEDTLVAAEFTCHFPEYSLFIHVLSYGFTPDQETTLNYKRKNIYQFLRYAAEHNIPVILPHPLYFYTRSDKIDLTLFEKLAVMFQRYEILNGQRDQWQSVLTLNWINTLSAEKIHDYARKYGLRPDDYAVNPEQPKILTGGSDDHMGLFAGQCGSYLHVPDLSERLKTSRKSELALEAIREGRVTPFGHVAENQKLNIALLDYFSQVATKIQDPGLLRIFFHRGEMSDKLACFTISNLLLEMQKNKNTQKFFGFVHDALQGKKLNKLVKWNIKKDYRFCIKYLENIANSKHITPEKFITTVNTSISSLYTELNQLIIERSKKSRYIKNEHKLEKFCTEEITRKFEIPSQLTTLLFGLETKKDSISGISVGKLLDNLSFPMLVSIILLGTTVASTRLLYQNRKFLNDFAEHIDSNHHPRRALYLTDTLRDKNGVSNSLSAKLKEIQRSDLPIDFLICHADAECEPHLHVVKPLTSLTVSHFGEQEMRIPDLMEIAKIFYEGGYDRIICSTEGPMALVSIFIKHMFNVPAYFFMHTDWLEFIKNTTDMNQHERDRIRRIMRFFYQQYSGVFVLNTEHRSWLSGHQMQLDENKVFLTAHHTNISNEDIDLVHKSTLFSDATDETPVLLFASRLSKEKGIFDLPEIIAQVKQSVPDIRIVIAGCGPDEDELKQQLSEALFLGWIDKKLMAQLYASLDLFVFPSRFDTFGNVVLESFVYGMPVIAYNCKGPKDIIKDKVNGYLVNTRGEFSQQIIQHFQSPLKHQQLKQNAILRSQDYQAESIMQQFMLDLGLIDPETPAQQRRRVA